MTATTAQKKLDRIANQITLTTDQLSAIDTEIRGLEDLITRELCKVTLDNEAIDPLEGKRAELIDTRERLKARITALQSTIPENEKAVNEAVLKEAKEECDGAVERVNDLLKTWKKKAKEITALEGIAKDIVVARRTVAGIVSKVDYLTALLGESKTTLPQAECISADEARALRDAAGRSCSMEVDPFYVNSYDELLKKLNAERYQAQRSVKRDQRRKAVSKTEVRKRRREEEAALRKEEAAALESEKPVKGAID